MFFGAGGRHVGVVERARRMAAQRGPHIGWGIINHYSLGGPRRRRFGVVGGASSTTTFMVFVCNYSCFTLLSDVWVKKG
jgi:hypothetical protein